MFRPKCPRSQSASPAKADLSKCTVCNETVTNDAMECMWCEMVQHRTCCKISEEQCKILSGLAGQSIIVYLCSNCMQNLPFAFKLYDDSKEFYSTIESKIESLEASLLSKLIQTNNSEPEKVAQEKSTSLMQVETLRFSIKESHDKLQNSVSSLATKVNDLHQNNLNLQSKLAI